MVARELDRIEKQILLRAQRSRVWRAPTQAEELGSPYAIDPNADYSTEPTTLVEFRLQEAPAGTRLSSSESGFEHIPLARRAEAFRMSDGGGSQQVQNIERHVTA
jgi:hypothetical protein